MNVSAIIVTRGNVDMGPIYRSLPDEWEVIIWDNSRCWTRVQGEPGASAPVTDLSVYGRYAAIEYASHDLIYVQDDDVIVSDPQAIVEEWLANGETPGAPDGKGNGHLVANMPQEFRHDGYTDSCLVGFGACFHRDAVARAFARFFEKCDPRRWTEDEQDSFHRTCDVVFTTLTPRVLVDVAKIDREFASDPDRMWKQPDHYGERMEMLDLARKVRDS